MRGDFALVADARLIARLVAVLCSITAGLMMAGGGVPSALGWVTVSLLFAGSIGLSEWARRPTPRWLTIGAPAVLTAGFVSRSLSVLVVVDQEWRQARLTQLVSAVVWLLVAYLWLIVWRRVLLPYSIRDGGKESRG